MGIKRKAAGWFVLAAVIVGYLLMLLRDDALNIDSDILSLLPATETDPSVEQAFGSFSEQSMRRLVLLVRNEDRNQSIQDAEKLAQALRSSPWISTVSLRQNTAQQSALGTFFFEHRHHLISPADEALLLAGNYQAFSDDAIRLAYAPFSNGLIELQQRDPFLLSWRSGNALAATGDQALQLDDGYLGSRLDDTFHILLTAELIQSPFNQNLQQELLAVIDTVETGWIDAASGSSLIRMGALFHTAYAYETARHEVSLIGGCSLLLIFLLLIMTFRSGWPLFLVVVALGFGVIAGFAAVRFVFGGVHLLTLVFGASLIGVAEDYAFHYFVIDNADSPKSRLAHILPALTLGLLTSILGYVALMLTPFPGLQQMAVFCICGLIAAYLTVVMLFPLISLKNKNAPMLLRLSRRLLDLCATRTARLIFYAALLLPFTVPVMLSLQADVVEDVRNFQAQDANLLAQEQYAQRVLDIPAANQFFLAKGETPESLLTTLEAAKPALDALVDRGAITGYQSIAHWLPSIRQQTRTYELYRQLYASDAGDALIAAGLITSEKFDAALTAFASGQDDYVYAEDFLQTPAGREYAWLWLEPEAVDAAANDANVPRFAAVIPLRGVSRLDLLDDFAAGEGQKLNFVDKISTVNGLLAVYRDNLGKLLAVACTSIFALLCLRYGLRKAAVIMTAPAIAISATVLGLTLAGEPLNLFSVLALFLVVGIGIDFGIFFAEDSKFDSRTLLAVTLSGITTILSFGLLSLSATTAIHSFGLSTLIGISTALILSPIVGNLITPNTTKTRHAQRIAG